MIDSGSPVSFLNSDLFQRIQKSLPPNSHYNERRIFSAVNGSSFVSTAVENLYFSVLGQVKCVEFHISESLFGHEIILGRDFLCLGYCLSFSKEGYRLEEQPTINKIEPNPLPPPVIVSPSSITNNCPIENKTPAVENYSTVFNLSGHVGKKMSNLLNKYKDAFAKSSDDIGKTTLYTHKIKTEGPAIRGYNYKPPRHLLDAIRSEIKTMSANGIIEKSESSYTSPIVLVSKPNGGRRFCVDFKRLNSQTIKDSYPLPTIEESLNRLSGCSVFSTLDLVSGFWQIPLNKPDR
jgi:hypothetical protein